MDEVSNTSLETGKLPSRLSLQNKILHQICLQLLSHLGPVNITLSWKHNGSSSMQIPHITVSIYYHETKYESSSKWCIVYRFCISSYTSLYSKMNIYEKALPQTKLNVLNEMFLTYCQICATEKNTKWLFTTLLRIIVYHRSVTVLLTSVPRNIKNH